MNKHLEPQRVDKDDYGFDHDVGDGRDFYVAISIKCKLSFPEAIIGRKERGSVVEEGRFGGSNMGINFL